MTAEGWRSTNAICASVNFDRFINLPPHEPWDHKWNIPVSGGPVFGEQVSRRGRAMGKRQKPEETIAKLRQTVLLLVA